jgi:Flp pilus assembly protein TadD
LPVWRDDLPLFAQALQQNPDAIRVRLFFASELARRGRYEEALGHLNDSLSREPNSREALIDKSGVQLSMNDFGGVRTTCSRVFEIEAGAARCFYNLGYIDEVEGRFAEARDKFQKAHESDPALTQALLHQGLMDARLGRLDAAANALEAAVQRIPTAPALNNLGSIYAERGEFAKAVRAFEAALRVDPSFELARRNLKQAVADSR